MVDLVIPKSNIDTMNYGFFKCISGFKYGVILGIHVSLRECMYGRTTSRVDIRPKSGFLGVESHP